MKISHYIFLSFLLILLLFSITTYINFRQSEAVKENAEYLDRSSQVVKIANRFQRNILSELSGLRGYLLTGEQYFVQSYDSAAFDNARILKELNELIPDTSIQHIRLKEIEELNARWIEEFAAPLKEAKKLAIVHDSNLNMYKAMYREKMITGDEKDLHTQLQNRFRVFTNHEYEIRALRAKNLAESERSTKNISFVLTASSILISLTIVSFLAHRISSRINLMVRLADGIASGDYKVHIEDTGKDELSKLSMSLNNMALVLSENISMLKRKNEELDQFAHIVSHDLKGPLRGIDNVVTWIEEDHLDEISPKVREYLDLIKGRIVRAENLIEGILSYARIDKERLQKEQVNISVLVREILDNITAVTRVRFDIQDHLPVVYTERVPLYQVFANLISNAIKYHDKSDGRISVYYEDYGSHFVFFVADDGPGIPQHYHERIFGIFQTLQDRDTFESTGVGLAIVKKILEARNEKIQVSSEPGKGSVFSFTWTK